MKTHARFALAVLALIIVASARVEDRFSDGRRGDLDAASLTWEGESTMFLGLRTTVYHVRDLAAAKDWYSQVLGFGPYFDEPFYVGFNVGGFELGLLPPEGDARSGAGDAGGAGGVGGVSTYWGVEDIDASMRRLIELGATLHEEVKDVGGDIRVGTVIDPFGNELGVIYNPHFEIVGQ